MFMEIAIGAIGIGIVFMVGYLVISQVKGALPTSVTMRVPNQCLGYNLNDTTYCNLTTYSSPTYGSITGGPFTDNTSQFLNVANTGVSSGLSSTAVTVFAGFSLLAVGIIVLAAFGLINVFK